MSDPIDPAIVEKAAKAIFDIRDDAYDMDEWEDIGSSEQELYLCQARAALEAATPLIAAKALREAAEAMRSCKDPGHWNLRDPRDPEVSYSPDVWLLTRADALEARQS